MRKRKQKKQTITAEPPKKKRKMKSSKAKTVVSTIAVILILMFFVGSLAALSGGFKDWDVKNWINPEYVMRLENYTFTGADSYGYHVEEYNPYATDKYILLPNKTNLGQPVTSLSSFLVGNSTVVGVRIPDGYKEIKSLAFGCSAALRKVYIPASVEKVGLCAFVGCRDITIYCEVAEQPAEWDEKWSKGTKNLKVVWGYRA